MKDCCWPELVLELNPMLERRDELELELELELDGSVPEGEVGDVGEFCAKAVAAINEAVIQNREVLTNTVFIIVLLSPFLLVLPTFVVAAREANTIDGGQSHVRMG